MTFDEALKLLVVAYAVIGLVVFVLATVFTVGLAIKIIRRGR